MTAANNDLNAKTDITESSATCRMAKEADVKYKPVITAENSNTPKTCTKCKQ